MKIQSVFWIVLVVAAGSALVAQNPPAPASQAAPVRVPGRPNSVEELEAFKQLAALTTPEDRIRQGNAFLNIYPNSGISAYVHYILANAHGLADPGQFVRHAELALVEIPDSPSLLATLAFIYAETGKTALGFERGRSALEMIQEMQKPTQLGESDWFLQKLEIGGQSNYAIGRHLLSQAIPDESGQQEKLREARTYLQRAMEQVPDDPYASFRLAEAYLQMQQVEQALTYFARTAAVGGSVGEIAEQRLRDIYQEFYKSSDGLAELLATQKQELEKARTDRQALFDVVRDQSKPTPGRPPGS